MVTSPSPEKFNNEWKKIFDKSFSQKELFSWRKEAFDKFCNYGLPNTRHEEWRYTPIRKTLSDVLPRDIDLHSVKKLELSDVIKIFKKEGISEELYASDVTILLTYNGYPYIINPSEKIHTESLFTKASLLEHNPYHIDSSRSWGMSGPEGYALRFINDAFLNDGLHLHIKKSATPTKILFAQIFDHNHPQLINTRQRISFDAGSHTYLYNIQIALNSENSQNSIFLNDIFDLQLAEKSHVHFFSFDFAKSHQTFMTDFRVIQQKESHFQHLSFAHSKNVIRREISVKLEDTSAVCHLDGIMSASEKGICDFRTKMDHTGVSTTSKQNFRGIFSDEARGVFSGRIFIRNSGKKTDARLTNTFYSMKELKLTQNHSLKSILTMLFARMALQLAL